MRVYTFNGEEHILTAAEEESVTLLGLRSTWQEYASTPEPEHWPLSVADSLPLMDARPGATEPGHSKPAPAAPFIPRKLGLLHLMMPGHVSGTRAACGNAFAHPSEILPRAMFAVVQDQRNVCGECFGIYWRSTLSRKTPSFLSIIREASSKKRPAKKRGEQSGILE